MQCMPLVENTGQYGVYDDWPSGLKVAGRLKQVMPGGAEDSNSFGLEADRWRNARGPGANEELANSARALLEQVPGFTGTLDGNDVTSNLTQSR